MDIKNRWTEKNVKRITLLKHVASSRRQRAGSCLVKYREREREWEGEFIWEGAAVLNISLWPPIHLPLSCLRFFNDNLTLLFPHRLTILTAPTPLLPARCIIKPQFTEAITEDWQAVTPLPGKENSKESLPAVPREAIHYSYLRNIFIKFTLV